MAWTNLIIGYLNYAYTATITSTNEDADFPGTNVRLDARDAQYRATTSAQQSLYFDMTTARQIDLVCAFDLNCYTAANPVMIYGGTTGPHPVDFSSNTDQQRLTPSGSTAHILQRHVTFHTGAILPQTYRYWEILLNTAAVVDAVNICGKCYLGRALVLSKSYVYGIRYEAVSLTGAQRSRAGAESLSRRKSFMVCRFSIPTQTKAQDDDVQTIIDAVGTHTPFPILFDKSNDYGRKTFWGRFTRVPDLTIRNANMHDRSFEFQEIV